MRRLILPLMTVAALAAPVRGQVPGRIEIRGWRDVFNDRELDFTSKSPSRTFTNNFGDSVTLRATPVVPGTVFQSTSTVVLSEPLVLTATISATRFYAAVGGRLSFEIRVGDPENKGGLCVRSEPGIRIEKGQSRTHTAEMSCSFTAFGLFNRSYDTSRVELDISVSIKEVLDEGASGGAGFLLEANYYQMLNSDSLVLSLAPPSPSPQVALSVRPTLTFSGSLFRELGTVESAVATVYVIDQDGRTAATSPPIRFTLNRELSSPFTLANVRLPQKEGAVRIYATLGDANLTKELATATVTYNAVRGCDLGGTITQEIAYRVNAFPDVRVELRDRNDALKGATQARLAGSVAAPSSTYCFLLDTPLDTQQEYHLRLVLQDGLDQPADLVVSREEPGSSGAMPYAFDTEPFRIPPSRQHDIRLRADNADTSATAAAAYWAFWRHGRLLAPASLHAGFRPGRISVYLTERVSPLYCAEPSGDACKSFKSAYLAGPAKTLGAIQFVNGTASLLYGDHIASGLYGPFDPNAGTASDPLSRAPGAGVAGLWAIHADQILKTGAFKNRDVNYRVEDDVRDGVGSLLWDLYDTHDEFENVVSGTSDTLYTDQAVLEMKDISRLLAEQRPKDLRELRTKLLEAPFGLGGRLAEPATGINPFNILDNVYRLHLRPATTLPASRPGARGAAALPVEGSSIDVTLVDSAGQPVSASLLETRYEFAAGAESLNSVSTETIAAGKVPFEMPPPHYDVRAYLSIPGSDEPPLVVDNARYWSSVPNANGSFLAHTFVVPDVPQVDGLLPNAAAAGARVRIVGRFFSPDTAENAVSFGAVRAAVISASPGELVVEVPRVLTRGDTTVTVAVAGRESNTAPYLIEAPVLAVAESSLTFGGVALGQGSERTITVRNEGDAPLQITGLASTSADFTTPLFAAPAVVEAGESREVTVRFGPAAAGSRAGSLVISTNDNVRRTATVALSGTGTAAQASGLAFTPGALGFGSVALGQARLLPVALRNAGSAPRAISAVASSLPALRLVSPAVPFTLAAGEARELTVELKPAGQGALAGSLVFTTDDAASPQAVLAVYGEGVTGTPSACTFGVTPAAVSFPAEGGTATVSVTAPAGCAWTASPSGSGFASASGSGSGSGSATVTAARSAVGRRASTVTVAGVLVAVSQEGATVEAETFVPIVLSTTGLGGTFFSSELTLTNSGPRPALVELTYTAAFGEGGGTARDVLPPGGQLVFPDALAYLRSLGLDLPATGNRGGTLRVRSLGSTGTSATVRTASVVPEGRAGLAYGGVPRAAQLTTVAYLTGLRQTATDRSNVAVLNTGTQADGGLSYRVTVFSGDPANPGTRVFEESLPPGGFRQFTEILRDLPFTQGYAKVERTSGNAPFTCYAVINDRSNGDGSFVPPVAPEALAGKAGLTLPVAVEAGVFDSEVVVTNFGTAPRTLVLTFVADAVTAGGGQASLPLTLAAGEQRLIPRFVDALRQSGAPGIGAAGAATYAGAVFLTVPSGDASGLAIGARTSAPGGGGRYGLFYTGLPTGAGATSEAWLLGLQQNAENRSNIAIVNTGEVDGSGSDFAIEIYDGDSGRQAAYVVVSGIGPRRWTQLSGILASRAPGVTNAYARVTRTSGGNPFLTYAVINDGGAPGQRTGDGAFVAMEVR